METPTSIDPTTSGPSSSWWTPSAWGIVALALVLRAAWAAVVPVEPVSDGIVYNLFARNIADGHGYAFEPGQPTAYWPVGTSALYAALYRAFGTGFGPIEVANVLIGSATVALTMLLARD